jgi:hypothetical protein
MACDVIFSERERGRKNMKPLYDETGNVNPEVIAKITGLQIFNF